VEPRTVCCDRNLICEHGQHAFISFESYAGVPCVHKHKVEQLIPFLQLEGVSQCMAYQGCVRNEFVALNERHLKEVPEPSAAAQSIWEHSFSLLREAYPVHPFKTPLSRQEVIEKSPQNRRNRIRNAFSNIDKNGWSDAYARVKCFTKFETFPDPDSEREMTKAARLIQHRSDEYCYTLARFLKRIEWRVLYKNARGKHAGRRLFAKGMTPAQKGSWVRSAWDCFARPVAVLMDHSAYDSHLTNDKRKWERMFYEEYYPGNKQLKHLLYLQKHNKCRTRHGIRYTMDGTMCSGDYNTSLGDNVINQAILLYATRNVDCRILCDGDDSVVVMDQSDLSLFDSECFAQVGLTTKVEYANLIQAVEFCQSRPIQTSVGTVYVRNPNRVLTKTAYTTKTYHGQGWLRLLKSIGLSELASNRGVPVLQAYAQMLIRIAGPVDHFKHEVDEILAHRSVKQTFDPATITPEARLDFMLAFDYSPELQIALEETFARTSLPCLPVSSTCFAVK